MLLLYVLAGYAEMHKTRNSLAKPMRDMVRGDYTAGCLGYRGANLATSTLNLAIGQMQWSSPISGLNCAGKEELLLGRIANCRNGGRRSPGQPLAAA